MSALSREVRRIIFARLTDRGMNAADIADELGVSRETVRRDLHNAPPPTAPEPAADVAPGEHGLSLPASVQLGKNLRIIAASHKRPAEAVAEELVHQHAEAIRARARAVFAA
ncbi:helix-turn-helix domain-containing protein [Streptomyces sp. NRRL S-813]|uniref:helix-turn-helix domain-containing protein n=1 Tax=Streptomyces sp. NRRL S-813 TaxID=1463919 RepID=UPI0004BF723E|nr:winged helix-turn-helix domain-containing protein [Streptomyces sp. NRRL S-813]